MIKDFELRFSEGTKSIKVDAKGVTILVGPNNSGKSLVLRELKEFFRTPTGAENKIVFNVNVEVPEQQEIDLLVKRFERPGPNRMSGFVNLGSYTEPGVNQISLMSLTKHNSQLVIINLLKYLTVSLDGRTRFELTNDVQMGDLTQPAQNVLAAIFQDDEKRKSIREIVLDAFGLYFVIDPTSGGILKARLSKTEPNADEQSLNAAARAFHANATHIKNASDGVQAFIGILMTIKSSEFKLILIDEPEAFLHPPLARFLGKNLALSVRAQENSMVVATHSADFLLGCLQGNENTQVIRLEYSNGKSKARYLDPVKVKTLFRHPLVRSANVMSALFYDGVIVTESDNDRVFYNELYLRLLDDDENYPSVLFINAQNKQTIKNIMEPLRAFGVAAAAITDIDFIKDGGKIFTDWLSAAAVPTIAYNGFSANRQSALQAFTASGNDMKLGGIDACLDTDEAEAVHSFCDNLNAYGIFPVRVGELERWLPTLKGVGKKTEWTIDMLTKMGDDPASASYVRPSDDDAWAFVRSIIKWIADTARKGT